MKTMGRLVQTRFKKDHNFRKEVGGGYLHTHTFRERSNYHEEKRFVKRRLKRTCRTSNFGVMLTDTDR